VDVAFLLDRVDGDDVRMVQRGERPRFTAESVEAIGIGRDFWGQDLQGDVAPERRVGGAIDGRCPCRRARAWR
jgi:hypothetical protein